MDRAARLLRGTLRVRVESAFPERVLNLCGAHGIAFSDLRWESVSALSFTVRAAERKKLERLLAPLDAALTVERAAGAPFFLRRFRRRYTLLAGLALMLALFFANSFFIWDFEVSGSETVPAEKILRVLEKQGLRRGSFAYSFRPQDICNRALPELPGVLGSQVNIADWRHEMKAIFRASFQQVFERLHRFSVLLCRKFFTIKFRRHFISFSFLQRSCTAAQRPVFWYLAGTRSAVSGKPHKPPTQARRRGTRCRSQLHLLRGRILLLQNLLTELI